MGHLKFLFPQKKNPRIFFIFVLNLAKYMELTIDLMDIYTN